MANKGKLKKGATLIELSVVLAVLSIISTMVVSFSIFLSERTKTTVKTNDLMQDVVYTKTITKSWVDSLTINNAHFSCQDGNLSASIDQNEYLISLNDKSLSATMPNGQTLSIKLNVITEIKFNIITNAKGNQTLYICKAFYHAENGVQYFSFAINPFVGDIVQGGA